MVFALPQVLACAQLGSMGLPVRRVLLGILDRHVKLVLRAAHLATMV